MLSFNWGLYPVCSSHASRGMMPQESNSDRVHRVEFFFFFLKKTKVKKFSAASDHKGGQTRHVVHLIRTRN